MGATLTEHQQFISKGGTPVVNGYVYYGIRGSDPVTEPIAIFSDRNLSIPLANPQRTNSDGRTVKKVWLGGSYSLKVEDHTNVQLYLQLDNGTITDTPVTFAVVRLATTTNINIAIDLEAADAIDGVTLVAGDDVLVHLQTNPAENGVYVVSSGGVALRAADFAAYDDYPGVYFSVMEGAVNADKPFQCTSNRGGTLEVTAIVITDAADVVGPASAVNERLAVYDGTSGRLIKDSGQTIADILLGTGAGDVVGPLAAVDNRIATFDGGTGKLIQDSGKTIGEVVVGPGSAVDDRIATFNGGTGKLIQDGGQTISDIVLGARLVGEVIIFSGSTAPTGWLNCDGDEVSRTTLAALFAVTGTAYGIGDGSTTFNLPDMRGRSPLGEGTGSGLTARAHGTQGGVEDAIVVDHNHGSGSLVTNNTGAHTHALGSGTEGAVDDVVSSQGFDEIQGQSAGIHNHVISGTSASTGSSGTDQNMVPFLALNFIIKT